MADNSRRELTIVLTGDAKGLTGTVKISREQLQGLAGDLDQVGTKARSAGRNLDDASKNAEKTAGRIGRAVGLVVGGVATAFTALVKHQLNVADATGKMAQRLGVSTEFLSSMGYAAKSTGSDMDTLTGGLQQLADSQVKAAAGQKQYIAAFAAMGIQVRDARGQLRSLSDLLPEIATRFRNMPDGPAKAALAVKLFGSEGTKLIPLLNQGADGLAAMSKEAAALGQVMDQDTVDQATQLNDHLARLSSMATGVANAFLSEMVPSLNQLAGGMGDAKAQGEGLATAGTVLANAFKGVLLIVVLVKNAVESVTAVFAAAISTVTNGVSGLYNAAVDVTSRGMSAASEAVRGNFQAAWAEWKQGWSDAGDDAVTAGKHIANGWSAAAGSVQDQIADVSNAMSALFKPDAATKSNAVTEGTRQLTDLSFASRGAAASVSKIDSVTAGLSKLAAMVEKLRGKAGTPFNEADAAYLNTVRSLASQAATVIAAADEKVRKGHMTVAAAAAAEATAQQEVSAGIDQASAARDKAYVKIQRELDVSGRLIEQMQQEARVAGLSDRDQAVARAGMQAEQELRADNLRLTKEQIAAQKDQVESAAAAAYDLQRAADFQRQVAQEYTGFWENAASSMGKAFGDLLTRQTRSWKDFFGNVKSIAQQFVSDVIAQFLRLRILGPLLSGAMGTVAGWLGISGSLGGSLLSQSANYYGGGSTISGAPGAVGGPGSGSGGGLGGYASYLSGIGAAKNAYTWASTGGLWGSAPASAPGMYGPYTSGYLGMQPGLGVAGPVGPYGGTLGGFSTLGLAGGALGAMWGLGRGGGGLSTVASTATGAIGGYAAGTAAATAISGGITAGLQAIPVVGWVALAAMAIDQVSGGKLFGTKYQTAASDATLSIGAGGADASASLYQTKQRALFGGRKTRVVDQAVSPEMQAAADALYDSIEKTMVQGAQKLGVDVPAMITASLNTHTTYNDKGQVRATEYVVNYLGQTWKEATAEAAAQRIGAEALVATVAQSAGAVAQQIAQQWRGSADTLLDGAQTMLAAQADINRGNSLVALGASATLAQVTVFVQRMQTQGEKLADTYARLSQASAQYLQFVDQFKPAATGFGATLQAIATQMQANINQADALAQAAGLQHAREEDLANIHRSAAQQAATAIAQLSAAAQDLVAKLYDVTGNSLAAVTAQLDKLHDKTQSALQLVIGDKSPMSDQEKLSLALQGLRSGLTSADDVLSLGRNLYASGKDYNDLFAQVQGIAGMPGGSGQPSLTDALGRYSALYAKQQDLQAQATVAARTADARTLAQYVADISTTHGIGYNDAASGLGFNLQDLAKDLGVTDIAGYLDHLNVADVPGTVLDASGSIVSAIQQLGRDLIQSITGAPITSASVTPPAVTLTDPQVIALLQQISQQLGQQGATTSDQLGRIVRTGDDSLRERKLSALRDELNR